MRNNLQSIISSYTFASMIKKILKKITSKYSFVKHLEDGLGFIKKHELKNVVVYDRGEYELVVCSTSGTGTGEYVVLSCNNEHVFEINFIPNSSLFAEILIKTAIRKYENRTDNGDSIVRASANRS